MFYKFYKVFDKFCKYFTNLHYRDATTEIMTMGQVGYGFNAATSKHPIRWLQLVGRLKAKKKR